MATKSFTTDLKFSKKDVDNLLKALNNDKEANTTNIKADITEDKSVIRSIMKGVKCR